MAILLRLIGKVGSRSHKESTQVCWKSISVRPRRAYGKVGKSMFIFKITYYTPQNTLNS